MADNVLSARDTVLKLARDHGVTYAPGRLDSWADAVTRHSGDDVEQDDIVDLILALERAKVLVTREADLLHIRYLSERGQ